MAYQVEYISDAVLTKKELRQKYKGKKMLFACKLKEPNKRNFVYDMDIWGYTLKQFRYRLKLEGINWTSQKISHIFRKYGNSYTDDEIEYFGFFMDEHDYMKYERLMPEEQPQFWKENSSDYKLYTILSR